MVIILIYCFDVILFSKIFYDVCLLFYILIVGYKNKILEKIGVKVFDFCNDWKLIIKC